MQYEVPPEQLPTPESTAVSSIGTVTLSEEATSDDLTRGLDPAAGYVASAYVPPPNCRSVYFQALLTPGYLTGTDCVLPPDPSSPAAPAASPGGETTAAAPAPSPEELALIAADKAMALAPSPVIQVAPEQTGLTGLDSFFWLADAPGPITATAGVSGLTVTAEARPAEYVWDFGDGQEKVTTEPGRPWTKTSEGSISHLYETKGSYDLGVEIIWRARWRADDGPWQELGMFSNSAGQAYSVKEVVSVLVSTER
ncbi:hypothetical protein BH20ACT22_BH20ACT22_00260 [soil metagenome]